MKLLAVLLLGLSSPAIAQMTMMERLNMAREYNGLKPLEVDSALVKDALAWAKRGKYVHASWVTEVLSQYVEDPLSDWFASKPHRDILLSKNHTKIGIACYGNICCGRLK